MSMQRQEYVCRKIEQALHRPDAMEIYSLPKILRAAKKEIHAPALISRVLTATGPHMGCMCPTSHKYMRQLAKRHRSALGDIDDPNLWHDGLTNDTSPVGTVPPGTVAILHDRPTTQGFYWIQLRLPQRMNYAEAKAAIEPRLADLSISGGSRFGLLHHSGQPADAANTLIPTTAQEIFDRGDLDDLDLIAWTDKKVAMIGSNGVIDSIGFYVYQSEPNPVPSGLQAVEKTYLDKDKNVLKEEGGNQTWLPSSSSMQQDLGAAMFPVLAVIAIFGIITLIAGVLRGMGGSSTIEAFTVPLRMLPGTLEKLLQLLQKGIDTAGNLLDAAGNVGKSIGQSSDLLVWGFASLLGYGAYKVLTR